MSFSKTGAIFKIAHQYVLDDYSQWENFKKKAAVEVEAQVEKTDDKKAVEENDLEVIASVDTEKFIYIHSTIMAGVKNEPESKHWITSETEKFINDNHDAWTCNDLLTDYKSFKRATTFVEHVQQLEKAKGRCIDVIARKLPDTVLIDVLFSVAKKHEDLVDNIRNGIVNAVSMGCSTEKTICSICGNEARDPKQYCQHVKTQKGLMVKCSDGKMRKVAEICKGNSFFDISLVANPAFIGAVFRKILSSEQLENQLLSNILSNKIESFKKDGNLILKAASAEIELENDGKVNIKSGEQLINSQEIPEENLKSIKQLFGNEKSATNFLKRIIKKFYNKDSGYHPIINNTTEDAFAISDEDYSPIPNPQPQSYTRSETERQVELRLRKPIEEGTIKVIKIFGSRIKQFECYNCGHKEELWQVKAASIDNNLGNVLVCPKCSFVMEKAVSKRKIKLSTIDILQLKDLGYPSDFIKTCSLNQIESILQNDKEFSIQCLKKGQKVVVKDDIPVDNDEGTLHFDEHGASVILKNEKLSFKCYVENKQYALFETASGEEFFMPVKKNNL